MKVIRAMLGLVTAAAAVTFARGGHELPVYPSYYPHEIDIRVVAPDAAADALKANRIQAYAGPELTFAGGRPEQIGAVETLGTFVLIRVNRENDAACPIARAILRDMVARPGALVVHPYPVTPLHGDYLLHADLADAARARWLGGPDASDLVRPDTRDAEIITVDARELVRAAAISLNGWLGPPWLRTGWFHASLLLDGSGDGERLKTGRYEDAVERINLERDLVASLAAGCRTVVAGYTVRRDYFSQEYSAGIENVGFDVFAGLASPMFIRTAKLKDFPWNGWMAIGIDAPPAAAWNPVGGFTDRFGSLVWSAVGDPAMLPSPYESGWMINRMADVQAGR